MSILFAVLAVLAVLVVAWIAMGFFGVIKGFM
jgi:hypothetical protein